MPGPLLSVIITASVPAIGRYLQNTAAADKAAADQRDLDMKTANDTLARVSGVLNRLLHVVREAMFGAVLDRGGNSELLAEDAEVWRTYRHTMTEWCEQRILNKANVESSFGPAAGKLLHEIDQALKVLGRQAEAAHFERTTSKYYITDGGENDFRVKFMPLHEEAEGNLHKLGGIMIRALQTGQVGSQRHP